MPPYKYTFIADDSMAYDQIIYSFTEILIMIKAISYTIGVVIKISNNKKKIKNIIKEK